MNKYLSDWLRIIEEMQNDNTYKTAWGRGIIECVYLGEYEVHNDKVIMNQSSIANKMIKYYWNQTFFFGLEQGRNPVILQKVKEMIAKYKEEVSTYPVPWNEAEPYFMSNENYYNKIISAVISNAKVNVCPRFKNVSNSEILDIYEIDHKNKILIFHKDHIEILKEYAFVLSKLFNYKWAQLLERFNTAPRITNKVTAASDSKIRRQSLNKYKKFLLEFYEDTEIRDFYTGEVIDKKDIHIDHVIPWSFIYSDDVWNLVVTSANSNLSKNNRPPTEEEIRKLKERNKNLLIRMPKDKYESYKKSIEYALEHNLIDKHYVNMKG